MPRHLFYKKQEGNHNVMTGNVCYEKLNINSLIATIKIMYQETLKLWTICLSILYKSTSRESEKINFRHTLG